MTNSVTGAGARVVAAPPDSFAGPATTMPESQVDNEQWDEYVASHPLGHHEQSSHYAETRQAFGIDCDRVTVRRGDRIIGGAQILTQRTPIGTLAAVHGAPLAVDDDSAVLGEVLDELNQLACESRWCSLRVNTLLPHVASRQALQHAGLCQSHTWAGSHVSIVNSLEHSEEVLLRRMDKKHRYHIRCAERAGVDVQIGDAQSISDFAELHCLTAAHHQFPCHSKEYFNRLWQVFGPKGRVQHFVAYFGDVAVAGAFNTIVGSHMIYGWGGLRREPEYEKLMASYLVHVCAMRWAREHGCTHYDFSGNSAFKRKFAGSEVRWPAPYRKYYGRFAGLRRALARASWSNVLLRRCTERLASTMGLRPRMPN